MNKSEYQKLLTDIRWKEKRLEIMKRDNYTCQSCGSKQYLQVHHTYYEKDNNPWDYSDEYFLTLCRFCHEKETTLYRHLKNKLKEMYLSGMLTHEIMAKFNIKF